MEIISDFGMRILEWEMLYACGSSKDTSKRPLFVQFRLRTCKLKLFNFRESIKCDAAFDGESSNWTNIFTPNVLLLRFLLTMLMIWIQLCCFYMCPHCSTDLDSMLTLDKKAVLLSCSSSIQPPFQLDFTNFPLLCIAHLVLVGQVMVFLFIFVLCIYLRLWSTSTTS